MPDFSSVSDFYGGLHILVLQVQYVEFFHFLFVNGPFFKNTWIYLECSSYKHIVLEHTSSSSLQGLITPAFPLCWICPNAILCSCGCFDRLKEAGRHWMQLHVRCISSWCHRFMTPPDWECSGVSVGQNPVMLAFFVPMPSCHQAGPSGPLPKERTRAWDGQRSIWDTHIFIFISGFLFLKG